MFTSHFQSYNQLLSLGHLSDLNCNIYLKREDQIHSSVSGNKFRKLKYNILEVKKKNKQTIVTFGGAHSNHIAATAAAGQIVGISTIGIIRGEELAIKPKNATLLFAENCGMKLHFISREIYKEKESLQFLKALTSQFPNSFIIPEGGTNALAVKGCAEILNVDDSTFDYICVPVGTGGTLAGIVSSLLPHQNALGFSALNGTFQKEIVTAHTTNTNYNILDSYNFGGYAKIDGNLVRFINEFKKSHGVQLDPVYTGKMMYGIADLMEKGYFRKNSSILAIHTGGLQGITGMNQTLKRKNLPLIQ